MLRQLSRATSIFLDLYQLNPVHPDLKLLGEIALSYGNLPWENLTKYLKKHQTQTAIPAIPEHLPDSPEVTKLRLSEEVMIDHARLGTGGTCFSLTNTLRQITSELGFRAYPVMADMRHGPDIHCGLVVELENKKYLLDPGYLLIEPVPLHQNSTVKVRFPGHRLEYRPVDGHGEIELYTVSDRNEEVFRYRLRPWRIPEDHFLKCWLESFDATGMNGLHLNRVTSDGRLSAHNLNLRIDTGHGKLNLKLREGYVDKVSKRFGIDSTLVRRAYKEWKQQRCRRE